MIWLKFHRHKAKEQKFGFAPGLKHCFPLEIGQALLFLVLFLFINSVYSIRAAG